LGIGDWAQSPIPNPQSPIPNPQSPINLTNKLIDNQNLIILIIIFNYFLIIIFINNSNCNYMVDFLFKFFNNNLMKYHGPDPYSSIIFVIETFLGKNAFDVILNLLKHSSSSSPESYIILSSIVPKEIAFLNTIKEFI